MQKKSIRKNSREFFMTRIVYSHLVGCYIYQIEKMDDEQGESCRFVRFSLGFP
ncbi:hypothetical protein RhiirC2_856813, partial [Rhizophagus irregularis]